MEQEPPADLEAAGRALWVGVTARYDLEPHEAVVLGQAARCADRLAALDAVTAAQGVTVEHPERGTVVHPAVGEARQQRLTLARLVAALRLPDEDDQASRPQRRSGARGVYGVVSRGAATA